MCARGHDRFRSIGRAFMSLECLLHEVPVEHELLVVDEACRVIGRMRVSVMPGQLINPQVITLFLFFFFFQL
jgi:hypothetical protein